MNKFNLIDNFFIDQKDYIDFLVTKKERTIANDEATCFATLEKIDEKHWLYTITWLPEDKYIGDYVIPFKASIENVDKFNKGCKILAERLTGYIETQNVNSVPENPPAFGDLTFVK